mgnify:FL=1
MKVPAAADQRLVERFCDAAWLADGLARNTLEAYRRDLSQFAGWLAGQGGPALLDAGAADIHRYLAWQVGERKAKPRTTGRLV